MQNTIEIAQQQLLTPYDLSLNHLESVVDELRQHQIDDGDVFLQFSRHESWVLEDGKVKEGSQSIEQGAGLRAIAGEKTGFAYSENLALPALLTAARSARNIARQGQQGTQAMSAMSADYPQLYVPDDPLSSFSDEQKLALLEAADRAARKADSRVKEVTASLSGVYEIVLVMDIQGQYRSDIRPLVRFNVSVIVEHDGRREQASFGGGGRFGYDYFNEIKAAETYAQEAVRQALVSLDAIDAPAGIMPVVLGAGWPGILLHEAVGHGLEGDFNRKGVSAFAGRIGEQVASKHCTIVDDGTLPDRRGSVTVDDEGVAGQHTVLIENGVLKQYMQDKTNARLMGTASTGNGRRESYAHLPMPRMTNTYMLAGQHTPEEIIKSVDRGLYAVSFGGGQVDITSGKFVFSASEAYLIEKGKITRPVKGAALIGNGPDVMTRVSMVGNDMQLDSGIGTCGKEGQSVPVGVGQPTLKVDEITVGGTAT